MSKVTKMSQVEAELFHTDGRIHRHDEASSEFSNAPKKYYAQKTRVSLFTNLRRKAEIIIYYKYFNFPV
jgi:hypothetical protein